MSPDGEKILEGITAAVESPNSKRTAGKASDEKQCSEKLRGQHMYIYIYSYILVDLHCIKYIYLHAPYKM